LKLLAKIIIKKKRADVFGFVTTPGLLCHYLSFFSALLEPKHYDLFYDMKRKGKEKLAGICMHAWPK